MYAFVAIGVGCGAIAVDKPKIKIRNPYARFAWVKKSGPHRDKRNKRRDKYPKQTLED